MSGTEKGMGAEEIAERLYQKLLLPKTSVDYSDPTVLIVEALHQYADARLAQRDLEQFGESFVLGGKRIGPNEIYKSTADYVKEARAERRNAGLSVRDGL